jgi:uncharacterized membrane protein
LAVGMLTSPLAAWSQTKYKVIRMPAGLTQVFHIDEQGQFAAVAGNSSVMQLCSTTACKPVTPQRPELSWYAMNDGHTVAGASIDDQGISWAVRKVKGQPAEVLGEGAGTGVSPDGAVIGSLGNYAFVYVNDFQPLRGLGDSWATAHAINRAHVVVGSSKSDVGTNLATKWVDGVPTALGSLPGDTISEAYAINSAGVVVGESFRLDDGAFRRAVRFENGRVKAFKSRSGYHAGAVAINNAGQIVGYMWADGRDNIAGIVEGDELVDLNRRLSQADRARYHLESAGRLNEAGQIAAKAKDLQTGDSVWVRLDPRTSSQ